MSAVAESVQAAIGLSRRCRTRIWNAGERWTHAFLQHSSPRLLLALGSVMIFASLFLPITLNIFSSSPTGLEYVRSGHELWPGILGLLFPPMWRSLYVVSLVAAVAGLLIVAAGSRGWTPAAAHSTRWLTFAAVGTALIVVADLFLLGAGYFAGTFLEGVLRRIGGDADLLVFVPLTITLFVTVRCLCAPLLRSQRLLRALFAVTMVTTLIAIAGSLLDWLGLPEIDFDDWGGWLVLGPSVLYWLIPLILWHRFGRSTCEEDRVNWPRIRHNLVKLYIAPALVNCALLACIYLNDSFGFHLYYMGTLLLALGYVRREAGAASLATAP